MEGKRNKKLYLSTRDGIEVVSLQGEKLGHAPLEGAGALCVRGRRLFCADGSGAIWRFDAQSLMPQAVFSGGPGICDLCLSPDGTRLYALLGGADSVLMSDACSGQALVLNRCGCNPRALALCGDTLAVAGGESGCVHLYHAHTLECLKEVPMPGDVCSVILLADTVYALCLSVDLSSLIVARSDRGSVMRRLPGMPGCLCAAGDRLIAAVQGRMYTFSANGLYSAGVMRVPGRPSRICACHDRILVYDPLSECAFSVRRGSTWRHLVSEAKAMTLSDT